MTPDPDGHDYLWDRSGPPDEDIVALERALGDARWKGEAAVPAVAAVTEPAASTAATATAATPATATPRPRVRARGRLAAAGLAVVVIGALGFSIANWWLEARPSTPGAGGATPGYRAEALSGSLAQSVLRPGDRLQTDAGTRARLVIGELGSVVVEPQSSVRVEATGAAAAGTEVPHRVHLESGALTASIFAAPRLFAVGTPSGLAVDLGCIYTARVEADGSTLLSVVAGQVSFETEGRQVLVPSGAAAHASPGCGPGTPVWDHAPATYRDAVWRLDRLVAQGLAGLPAGPAAGQAGDPPDEAPDEALARALDDVLTGSRGEDTLTLWHLFTWSAMPAVEGERVFAALATLAPPPEGVPHASLLAREGLALEQWRETFVWAE